MKHQNANHPGEGTPSDLPENQCRPFIQINQSAAFELLKNLDPSDFKVFVFLTLRAYGWDDKARRVGDGITRASATFVAKGTGLSEATSEKCIARLKQKELISKHQHSCKWGNTYSVKSTLLRNGASAGTQSDSKKKSKNTTEPGNEKPKDATLKTELPESPPLESATAKVDSATPETTQPAEDLKNEGPNFEGPKNKAPSSLESKLLEAQNLGTNIDSRTLDLSLSFSLNEVFENYFSKIRSPMTEKKERACLGQIQKRNPDVTTDEFLECFKIVSETRDAKGNPIVMKMFWMSNGFDSILGDARQRIKSKKRREEERQREAQAATAEAEWRRQVSPQEAERAKEAIRTILGRSFFQSQNTKQDQSETDRRTFLLAQARELQQTEKYGHLNT